MTQSNLRYLSVYPESIQDQVRTLIAQDQIPNTLLHRYPDPHLIRNDGALFDYLTDIKNDTSQKVTPSIKLFSIAKFSL